MRNSRTTLRACVLASAAVLAGSAMAFPDPRWDLNGTWSNGTAPIHIHQDGSSVTFRYTTSEFDHVFRGNYVSPTMVVGRYAPRRNRTTGCTTTLAVRISVTEPGAFVLHWRALDSNCDLAAGQSGSDAPFAQLP